MISLLLDAARDSSFYFHSAYSSIGIIITVYSFILYLKARKIRGGKNG
jgi:hypothetical protein